MTIFYRSMSGFGMSRLLIKHITMWSKEFGARGTIGFLPSGHKYIVDVGLDAKGDVELSYYPHCDHKELVIIGEKNSERIQTLVRNLTQNSTTGQIIFTINIETVEPVTDEHFSSLFPIDGIDHNLFIFKTDDPEVGFPNIYAMPRGASTGLYTGALRILARSSLYIADPTSNGTTYGKKATWALIAGWLNKAPLETIPDIAGMSFPTNGLQWTPETYDCSGLEVLRKKIKADRLVVKAGITVDEAADEMPTDIEPLEGAELEAYLGDLGGGNSDDSDQELELRIQRSALDKDTVSFTDMINLGIVKTLKALPIRDRLVRIDLEYSDAAQKMWIYEGKVYYIPTEGVEVSEFTGESDELFVATSVDLSEVNKRAIGKDRNQLMLLH